MKQQRAVLLEFGRHRGGRIQQLSDAYLQWMLQSFPRSSQWHQEAALVLTTRTNKWQQQGSLHAHLKHCSTNRDLESGRRLHALAVNCGNEHVIAALIRMYARCGSMVDARLVFNGIHCPDVVSWTALLLGYAENGEGAASLELFTKMKADRCVPNSVTYVAVLKACASLAVNGDQNVKAGVLGLGRTIHSEAGYHLNLYVQNTLIDMYSKCGSMVDAHRVFDIIQNPDVVSWNALLLGYVDNGQESIVLDLFSTMSADRCARDSVTYIAVLRACTSLAVHGDGTVKAQVLGLGRRIHSEAGCHLNLYVQSTLIDMYAKCGSTVEAHRLFDTIEKPNVVSWTALISGYVENGEAHTALKLFFEMKSLECVPNSVTYVAAIKACTLLAVNGDSSEMSRYLEIGRSIHSEAGCYLNLYLQNTLVDMYGKCGSMREARGVFSGMQKPDVVSWNALIAGYAENGEGRMSLDLFSKMKADGYAPNSATYVAALKACTSLAKAEGLEAGREIHLEIGVHLTSYVESTLIDMYAKCGSMTECRKVFDSIHQPDVVSWTALILGYAANGEWCLALDLLWKMKADGCAPNSVTYIAALKACISLAIDGDVSRGLKLGREVHSEIDNVHLTPYMLSTLIDMYAKCGSMVDARRVFDSIPKPNVVAWTALLLGYAENGESYVALDLFSRMKAEQCEPDFVTYVAVLKACGSVGALALGRKFHSEIREFDVHVVTCLVDFYAKCGSMQEAREVFDLHSKSRDATTWNALLAGYSSCGDTGSVFGLFDAMQDMGFRPDSVTFVSVLLCCSHAGLASKARQYLEAMPVHYEVAPDVFHYNCMVDVLGRANQLNEAVSVLRSMPCSPNDVTWSSLLSACREWKNVGVGTMAFQSLAELNKKDASAYMLMAHIYGGRGMWKEQARMLESRC